jgi:hypothetical protein
MDVQEIVDDIVIKHFGVKGMRWGVRTRNTLSVATGLPSPKRSRQIQKESAEKRKVRGRRAGDHILEKGFAISTPGSRARGAAAAKSARKVTVKDKGKRLKTSGGKGVATHPDALRAHKLDQIVKKSGTKALSNEDLQAYSTRLQLEQSVSRISSNNKSAGAKVSKLILARAGNKAIDEVLNASTRSVKKTIYRMIN